MVIPKLALPYQAVEFRRIGVLNFVVRQCRSTRGHEGGDNRDDQFVRNMPCRVGVRMIVVSPAVFKPPWNKLENQLPKRRAIGMFNSHVRITSYYSSKPYTHSCLEKLSI